MRANISQFLEINCLICDDYDSHLSECPVKRRGAYGREKLLHFFSTAKYLYSPFSKRKVL